MRWCAQFMGNQAEGAERLAGAPSVFEPLFWLPTSFEAGR
jgi:hypothetical protein